MAFTLNTLNIDLLNDTATVALNDPGSTKPTHVHVTVPIVTPGNQPENRLKDLARAAAKQALIDAANAL